MISEFDLTRVQTSWGGVPLRGASDELIIHPSTSDLPVGPQIKITLKADAPVVDALRARGSGRVPLDVAVKPRRPRRRRHPRGGLRPMIAGRVLHFTSHGTSFAGGIDKPWKVTFNVTRRTVEKTAQP